MFVELSAAQVDGVVRAAADGGSLSVLISGRTGLSEALARGLERLDDPRLSRLLMVGLVMLASFPMDGSYVANAEIALMLGMNPSTSYRYLSTLEALGLVERHPETRRYRRAG